jgi:bacteriocin-like protein
MQVINTEKLSEISGGRIPNYWPFTNDDFYYANYGTYFHIYG